METLGGGGCQTRWDMGPSVRRLPGRDPDTGVTGVRTRVRGPGTDLDCDLRFKSLLRTVPRSLNFFLRRRKDGKSHLTSRSRKSSSDSPLSTYGSPICFGFFQVTGRNSVCR